MNQLPPDVLERLRAAQHAMRHGEPIPDEVPPPPSGLSRLEWGLVAMIVALVAWGAW